MFLLTQVSLINFKQLFCNLFIFVNLLVLKSVSIAVFDWRKYLNRKSSLILGFQGHPTRI